MKQLDKSKRTKVLNVRVYPQTYDDCKEAIAQIQAKEKARISKIIAQSLKDR